MERLSFGIISWVFKDDCFRIFAQISDWLERQNIQFIHGTEEIPTIQKPQLHVYYLEIFVYPEFHSLLLEIEPELVLNKNTGKRQNTTTLISNTMTLYKSTINYDNIGNYLLNFMSEVFSKLQENNRKAVLLQYRNLLQSCILFVSNVFQRKYFVSWMVLNWYVMYITLKTLFLTGFLKHILWIIHL